jgi:hypothetical protein
LFNRAIICGCLACLVPAADGCAGRHKATPPPPAGTQTSSAPPAAPANAPPATDTAASRAGDLNRMMGELQALGTLDPKALDQLLKDLQQTDPALWPQVMQVFRASVAYRQRMQAREAATAKADAKGSVGSAADPTALAVANPATASPPEAGSGHQPAPLDGTLTVAAQPVATNPAATPAGTTTSHAQAAGAVATTATASTKAGESPPAGAVRQVSYEEPAAADSQQLMTKTIQALENAPDDGNPSAHTAQQVYLRMLYLAAGRRDDAMRPIAGLPANEQEFWSEQLFGLSTYLDSNRSPDARRRAAEARVHLNNATSHLSETGELLVRNLAFCTEVHSYGVFTPFASQEFKPGQQVILYAEVENFKSESTPKGFHTALKSSYQIFDQQGRRVMQHDLGTTEEHCRNGRRDYFIRYFLTVPGRIYDGTYTLHLTIEDTLGRKIGQSTIDFTAKEKEK